MTANNIGRDFVVLGQAPKCLYRCIIVYTLYVYHNTVNPPTPNNSKILQFVNKKGLSNSQH